MKVIKPGLFVIDDQGRGLVQGWHFMVEPGDERDHERATLRAVLLNIADRHGLQLVPPVEPIDRVPLDVERATLDVIAMCRWPAQEGGEC